MNFIQFRFKIEATEKNFQFIRNRHSTHHFRIMNSMKLNEMKRNKEQEKNLEQIEIDRR